VKFSYLFSTSNLLPEVTKGWSKSKIFSLPLRFIILKIVFQKFVNNEQLGRKGKSDTGQIDGWTDIRRHFPKRKCAKNVQYN